MEWCWNGGFCKVKVKKKRLYLYLWMDKVNGVSIYGWPFHWFFFAVFTYDGFYSKSEWKKKLCIYTLFNGNGDFFKVRVIAKTSLFTFVLKKIESNIANLNLDLSSYKVFPNQILGWMTTNNNLNHPIVAQLTPGG